MVKIDFTKFGEISIDGKIYYSDMLVCWDGTVEFRAKKHIFDMDDFAALLKRKPDIIVIGTGQTGVVKVSDEVVQIAEDKKIKLYVDPSPKAVDVFNGLVAQGKKAIALIHTTC
jgi:hypothetical protein